MKPPIEFKVVRIQECISPAQLIDTPEQAMDYWRANIPSSSWYLRIRYGPEYTATDNLERLRSRGLAAKRSLAIREFALGIVALVRFVRNEPLRRVHECLFGWKANPLIRGSDRRDAKYVSDDSNGEIQIKMSPP